MAMVLDIAMFGADISALCLLLLAWARLDGVQASVATVIILLLAGGRFLPLLVTETLRPSGPRRFAVSLLKRLFAECVQLLFLADRATYTARAALTSLWRVIVTRRNLVDWQPRAVAARAVEANRRSRWIREMWPGALIAALAIVWSVARGDSDVVAYVVLGLWILAPLLARGLSVPAQTSTASKDEAEAG
jgi:hypothetical protein